MRLRGFISGIILTMFFQVQTVKAQSLFFSNLNNSYWSSEFRINDSLIQFAEKIPLTRINISPDSLKHNCIVWNFKDGRLLIYSHKAGLQSDSILTEYSYEMDQDRSLLKIKFEDGTIIPFKAGLISTGNFAVLYKP